MGYSKNESTYRKLSKSTGFQSRVQSQLLSLWPLVKTILQTSLFLHIVLVKSWWTTGSPIWSGVMVVVAMMKTNYDCDITVNEAIQGYYLSYCQLVDRNCASRVSVVKVLGEFVLLRLHFLLLSHSLFSWSENVYFSATHNHKVTKCNSYLF